MQEWWSALSMTLRVLYCIAVPSTLLLLLQMLLTIVGGGHDGGVDISDTSGIDMPDTMDFDIDADTDVPDTIDGGNPADFGNLRLLTLQTLVTFLAVFGWVSIICISSGMPNLGGIAIGTACGLAMMFLVAKIVQASRKLVENGVLNLKNASVRRRLSTSPFPRKMPAAARSLCVCKEGSGSLMPSMPVRQLCRPVRRS